MAISQAAWERRIVDRCWHVYDGLTGRFEVPEDFLLRFLEAVESAVLTDALQAEALIGPDHRLSVTEEYELDNQELSIALYSYVLLTREDRLLLRADPRPHYAVDYRGQPLSHPPHHLHDERNRIRSFTGSFEEFIELCAGIVHDEA